MVLGIDILHRAGSLKHGLVDGHAVGGHAEGELIVSTGGILAGALHAGADVSLLVIGPQVAQIDHQTLGAPVGNQTLGTFHNEVRGRAALDGGVDLIVTVGVVQILNSHMDVGVLGVEVRQQSVNRLGITPLADGVGPQGDVSSLTGLRSGGSLAGSGGRGAFSGRGRCAGGSAAAANQQAGSHTGSQNSGYLLLHSGSPSFAFRHL